jgi:predicted DNA-binding protein
MGGNMKGRSSVMVGIRIPDEVHGKLKIKADILGLTVSAYITKRIVDSVNQSPSHSVNSIELEKPDNHSVNQIDNQINIPTFNPKIHKAGDKVKKWDGSKWVVCIVPEVDAEGYVINDLV